MALADGLKPLLLNARSIAGRLGLRPYSVKVRYRYHGGTFVGEGAEVRTDTAIVEANGQPPKVRALNDEELAVSGLAKGTWEIGPITPEYSSGGLSFAQLVGTESYDGEQIHYVLTGPEFPDGASFVRVGVTSDRALHYRIRVEPITQRD